MYGSHLMVLNPQNEYLLFNKLKLKTFKTSVTYENVYD